MITGDDNPNTKPSLARRFIYYSTALILSYKGGEPFHLFLKKYFASQKKHGSRDRKLITALCYAYFRVGHAVSASVSIEEKMKLGYFLTENKASPLWDAFPAGWKERIEMPLANKLDFVKPFFNVNELFPLHEFLSGYIDKRPFVLSFLIQPLVFVRIRPGRNAEVLNKINAAGIEFGKTGPNCLSFTASQKITDILKTDREVVIQDWSSQQVATLMQKVKHTGQQSMSVWDCCAASGGKSILAVDVFQSIKLTVTDTRKNILENLKSRFKLAGIKGYQALVADLSVEGEKPLFNTQFDLIIADVPCSGSGTWARNPEQLHFFAKGSIDKYVSLQRKIIDNSVPCLQSGGYFLYITCSVFKK